jgi:murein DD-endopeptidase MepM/ murein hydrolase activator NlpD
MTSNNIEERLRQLSGSFSPLVPVHDNDKIISMDFTENNKELTDAILDDEDLFIHYVYTKLEKEGARYGIGGYDEHRAIYKRSGLFGEADDDEPRRLHLGVDIWGRPHTPVMAPLTGIIHSLGHNDNYGDYGATVIMSHQIDGQPIHTLYGHLSLNTLKDLEPGQTIMSGDIFGEFGLPIENGHWPPHLHFQIILDLQGWEGNYPGVCKYSEREKYLANCPDPNLMIHLAQPVS